jgi:hypothetical protein|tara:strand:+ start:2270 stop:2689 length:420 start_codon:yes stop_codon:yes gene_type:complete
MIVLTTSNADQTFSVIPREYVTDAEICIRDESTNEQICVLSTGSDWNTNTFEWQLANYDWEDEVGIVITNDIMYITMNLDLLEGRFYDLKISNTSGTVIFRDKIFCTDQTIDQETNNYYDMNQGLYIENTSGNNDYIIY